MQRCYAALMSPNSQQVFILSNMQTTATFPAGYSEGVKYKYNYVMMNHLIGKPENNCFHFTSLSPILFYLAVQRLKTIVEYKNEIFDRELHCFQFTSLSPILFCLAVKRFKPIVKYKNEIFGKELHE
jgi:hypothetical protein